MTTSTSDITSQDLIQVAVVDDHLVLVDALRTIIQTQRDMTVIGTAGNCADALKLLGKVSPQVLLLDVMLPDGDGIGLVPQIKQIRPDTNILILTSLSDEASLIRAMQAGVSGYMAKNINLTEVLKGIRQAASGEIAVPTSLLLGLLSRAHPTKNASPGMLITQREREILTLLAGGRRTEAIAQELNISAFTARTHIRNLLQKLGVHSRLQAVTYAMQNGLIDPPA